MALYLNLFFDSKQMEEPKREAALNLIYSTIKPRCQSRGRRQKWREVLPEETEPFKAFHRGDHQLTIAHTNKTKVFFSIMLLILNTMHEFNHGTYYG